MAIATGTLVLSSCADEKNYYDENYKKELYAANWEKQFGQIDPNQDWCMATKVTANANIPNTSGVSELNIYTNNPILSESKLLATAVLDNGVGSVTFDALKGMDQVFVSVENNGKKLVYGYADIVNGVVNARNIVSKKAKTRAASDVTKGEVTELPNVKYEVAVDGYYWLGNMYTWDELVAYTQKFCEDYLATDGAKIENIQYKNEYEIPFIGSSIILWETVTETWGTWNKAVGISFDNAKLQNNVEEGGTETRNVALTSLNGVETAAAEPWLLSWGYEMFGPGSFFQEQKKYYVDEKRSIQGYDIEKIEQGFSITTEGGEISLPFIYGATNISDRFGYVYYKEGDDPLTQPHYILMSDGTPPSNIYYNSWKGSAVTEMGLANWSSDPATPLYGYDAETLVYGTEYKLAFFGENHDQTATYNFPAGYHIVFFVAPFSGDQYTIGNFNYSLPELNARINHLDYNTDCPTYDAGRGAIKATAWTYNGYTFLGFEDGGGDEDLNDIVFWVEGEYKEDQTIIDVPSTTKKNTESQSWILACEDLGDTEDYDFNDIVLEVKRVDEYTTTYEGDVLVSKEYSGSKLVARCLAAGGTLPAYIYYNDVLIGESHEMIGAQSTTQMVNTQGLTNKNPKEYTIATSVEQSWSIVDNIGNFKIIVEQEEGSDANSVIITGPETGTAPQIIVVPGEWEWPTERTRIEDAYPAFINWNSNAALTDWNSVKVAGKVINRK